MYWGHIHFSVTPFFLWTWRLGCFFLQLARFVLTFLLYKPLKILAQNISSEISKSKPLTIRSWFQRDLGIHQLPVGHKAQCVFSDETFFEKQVIYFGDSMKAEIFWNSDPINIHLCIAQTLAGSWMRKLQMSQGNLSLKYFWPNHR